MSRPDQPLYAIVRAGVTPLLTRVLQRVLPVLPQPVQRLGARALPRLLRRFRELAELIGQPPPRTQVADAGRAPRPSASAAAQPKVMNGAPLNGVPFDPEPWLAQLESESTWQRRAAAARALRDADDTRAVGALGNALRDRSAEVAAAAAGSLAGKRDPRAVTALRAVVENADRYYTSSVRAAAITALASRGTDLEPVFDAVRDIDAEVSVAAIFALHEFAPQAAAQHLLPLLQDRSGYFLPLTRIAALHALTRGGALTRELAAQLLQTEPDGEVRAALARLA